MSYWDMFFKTGRIADYLKYCEAERNEYRDNLEGSCDKRERQGRSE